MQNYDYIKCGDCLDLMSELPDESIDLILCDLPYGTTRNKWDSPIPLDELWMHYKRIIKHRGAIVLFGQLPFSAVLAMSNLPMLKYEWIWDKSSSTGFLNSQYAPLKKHEQILVFSKSAAAPVKDRNNGMVYNPQFRTGKGYVAKQKGPSSNYDFRHMNPENVTINDGTKYFPLDVIQFKCERGLHPTQKPIDLLRYLIRTYTYAGGVVLDNCVGSGSTAIAAIRENRHFIGYEKDEKYFEIALRRIKEEQICREQ